MAVSSLSRRYAWHINTELFFRLGFGLSGSMTSQSSTQRRAASVTGRNQI